LATSWAAPLRELSLRCLSRSRSICACLLSLASGLSYSN
jgi:hypothetical protein